ncbi:AfsR/SARP family transcriptional regulator [Streptosporangium carneum]|uniref:AfsR/SARP family transcriptional regulator n=1 Tax=Streptosporangium carneum TaxID=47481 RepID=UPI0022F2BB95|nr:BTAD domain-containing putative transcriptional regulator [Streptosporangium carneum]
MRFSVLGPLTITRDGVTTPVSSGKIRTLLASLLLRPNQVVSVDQLVERLWEERSPRDPRRVVQTTVVRLRQTPGLGELVLTRPGGYVARLEEHQLDLLEFLRLTEAAEAAADPEEESRILRRALALWRGPACEDVDSTVLHRVETPPLAERRLLAVERRIDLDLRSGRDEGLVAELRALTAEHPLRERFRVQLMAALHRGGRQAEALDAYRAVFQLLQEELGIAPGEELRTLHQAILTGDHERHPLLASGPPVHGSGPVPGGPGAAGRASLPVPDTEPPAAQVVNEPAAGMAYPPQEIPSDISHFVGRADELGLLDKVLAEGDPRATSAPRAVVIVGSAGIGKTALATRWCTAVAPAFPDGQLHINLRGFETLPPITPLCALATLLRSLGVPPQDIPRDLAAASALFRTRTAGRRMIVFLDNVSNTEQARPLLPGRGCVAVITSRNQLRGLVAREAIARISVSPLEVSDSLRLLGRVAGEGRIEAEEAQARALASLCDNSPLALRIIGERLARQPDRPLAAFVEELGGGHERLDAFDSGDDAGTDLRTVLSWSYESLSPQTARVLRLVGGLYPGAHLSLAAASAVCDLPVDQTRRHLDQLVATHLVEQHGHDRYHLHDLVRAYAAEQTLWQDSPEERDGAISRLLAWFAHSLFAVDVTFAPDRHRDPLPEAAGAFTSVGFADHRAALRWCELEHSTFTALPAWAYANRAFDAACQIAYLLENFLAHYKDWHILIDSHRAAVSAARENGDRRLEGHLLNAMGNAYAELHRREEADRCYQEALSAFDACDDLRGRAKILGNLAMLAIDAGDYETAWLRCVEALDLCTRLGNERGRAHNLDNLGEIHFGLGDFGEAVETWRAALEMNRRGGSLFVQATNLTNLGRAFAALDMHDQAIARYQEAIAISRTIDSDRGLAAASVRLGDSHHALGDTAAARDAWAEALGIYSSSGDPRAEEVRTRLTPS